MPVLQVSAAIISFMRLQKMGTYRFIRILRVVLPIVVLVLIAIPARNYLTTRESASASTHSAPVSPPDVEVHTLGESFHHREGGRDVFQVDARELVSFKNNKHELRDVHVVIFGEKPVLGEKSGDFDQTVQADSGIYDQETKDIHFFGNVRAQLDEETWITTEELVYVNQDRMISSPVRTHVEQPGEMTGDADRLSYSKATKLLTLNGSVGMKMSNGESLHADAAQFQKLENWTSISGNILLEASNGWLRGNSGHADLEPGTYHPTLVTIEGDVSSESRVGRDADSPDAAAKSDKRGTLRTHSNRLVSVISPQGVIQSLAARGDVSAEQVSKDEIQTMTGDEIDATMSSGHVDTMEARRPNKPFAEMKQSGRSIISDIIHIKSNGTTPNEDGTLTQNVKVTTGGNSSLQTVDTLINGKDFIINQSGNLVFETAAFTTIFRQATPSSEKRITSADSTKATINNKTNALEGLTQKGHFKFSEGLEGQRTGSADSAEITQNGDRVELTGNFRFQEATRSGKANRAVITDNGNTIDMHDSVSFVDGPRHGSAAHAKFTNGGDVVLDSPAPAQPARMKDDEKNSEIQARQIKFNQNNNHMAAEEDVFTFSTSQSEEVTVNAARATSDGDQISYYGNVKLWRGDGTYIHADKIVPTKDNGFTATGHVDSQIEGMKATAEKLEYDDAKKIAVYTGKVDASNDDKNGTMKLTSDTMTVVLNPSDSGNTKTKSTDNRGGVKEIQANGHVNLTQGPRKGTGDRMVYDYKTEVMTMWANPGSEVVFDEPNRRSVGIRVEWNGDKVRLEPVPGGKEPSISIKPK